MSISAIEITGGYYKEKKQFKIFSNTTQAASIIYGKNGSGKSSIARAFNEAFTEVNKPEFSEIYFFKLKQHPNQGLDPLTIDEINIPSFVHNEEFTLEKVSFNEDGLETIVMFGEQIEITTKIDKLTNISNSLKDEHNLLETNYITLNSPMNSESHFYIKEVIRSKLKSSWANRHQLITGNKTAGRVDENLINIISYENVTDKFESLNTDFKNKLKKYNSLKLTTSINKLIEINFPQNITTIIELLKTALNEPILTDREKEILHTLSSLNDKETNNTLEFLNSKKLTCQTCLQDVSPQHKLFVLNSIQKILNTEEANKLKSTLLDLSISPNIKFTNLDEVIDKELINILSSKLDFLNTEIENINEAKKNKINNPYKSLELKFNIKNTFNELNDIIKAANIQIDDFNEEIKQKNKLLNDLKALNLKMAFIESKDLVNIYKERLKSFNQLKYNLDNKAKDINEVAIAINQEQAALGNVQIALELINSYLQYIFYDENRLYLSSSQNTYTVMSRNEPVKPSSLSIGEKNIISLCYFFSTLFKDENINQLFKKECILILDDPLSSFDFENKVGVYSFLRYILNELHCGNTSSKSIILTHDLDVLYNMVKVYSDININVKKKKLGLFNLLNKNLEVINTANYDEYSQLLQNIYNFTIDSSVNDLNIGNNLRRVLEAYATFNYKCGMEELTRNPEILIQFTEAQRIYFSNSMYRLILNTESHLNERSRLILSTTFKEHFSIDEKVKTAKDILMFLYLLNPLHLRLHLKTSAEDINIKAEQINTWINNTFPPVPAEPPVSIIS